MAARVAAATAMEEEAEPSGTAPDSREDPMAAVASETAVAWAVEATAAVAEAVAAAVEDGAAVEAMVATAEAMVARKGMSQRSSRRQRRRPQVHSSRACTPRSHPRCRTGMSPCKQPQPPHTLFASQCTPRTETWTHRRTAPAEDPRGHRKHSTCSPRPQTQTATSLSSRQASHCCAPPRMRSMSSPQSPAQERQSTRRTGDRSGLRASCCAAWHAPTSRWATTPCTSCCSLSPSEHRPCSGS